MGQIGRANDRREAALLSVFGPAQVGDPLAPDREVAEADRQRDRALRTEFVRVVGADGRPYLVERPVEPPVEQPVGQSPQPPAGV